MEKNTLDQFIHIAQEEDKKVLFDQYKIVVDSLNKFNEIREIANTFWTGINGALITAIAYIRDTSNLEIGQKTYFIWTIIFLGVVLSFSWLSYLSTIKKSVEIRNDMLIQFEKYFPAKIFTVSVPLTAQKSEGGALSVKEMFVPGGFLAGYIFFAVLFYFYPAIVVQTF
ncbi:MAG: hypothetical protein JSR85_04245 [Proteobacteria bacterium]|nr:hypothetical protein [Pseudomonadota bacterium]